MLVNLSVRIPSNTTCSSTLNILNSRGSKTASRTCCNFSPALLAATDSPETFSNVPQTLSGDDNKPARIQRPRSRKSESCTTKRVGTCIRGGAGSPGEGPLSVRPLVVFKQGFRSRQYCLVECSDNCNLIKDGEDHDGPQVAHSRDMPNC